MKRLLSAALALLFVAGAFSLPARAAEKKSGHFIYTVNKDGTVTITGYEEWDATRIDVPEKLAKRRVTAIGEDAFSGLYELESVTLPEGLLSIGGFAFFECENLKTLKLPDSLTSLGNNPFAATTAEVELSPGHAAYELVDGALYDKRSRVLVALLGPERASFAVAEGTEEIGPAAFFQRTGLQAVSLPDSLRRIANSAFSRCTSLSSVDIPAGVTSIGTEAFSENFSLQRVSLPEGLTFLGWDAFSDCTSLTAVALPMGLRELDGNPFARSPAALSVPEGHPVLAVTDGVLFDKTRGLLIRYPFGDPREAYAIPEGTEAVGSQAFYGAEALLKIRFPEGLKSIGDWAFFNTGVSEIVLPESLVSLGGSAFSSCMNLTSVTLPIGLKSLGERAFSACESLTNLALPKGLKEIGEDAFPYGVTLQVVKGSAADKYAKKNGIAVKYIKN